MSDISLLMSGVLKTGQPSQPYVPENSPVQLDNYIKQSKQSHLSEVVPIHQITPPEFMLSDGNVPVMPLAIASDALDTSDRLDNDPRFKNISDSANFSESQNSQVELEDAVVDSLDDSNVKPEFTPISETNHVLLASNSVVKYKTVVQNPRSNQPIYLAGGELPQRRFRNRQTRSYRQIAKLPRYTGSDLPILRFGYTGNAVRVLQRLLLSNGYAIQVDGAFGALTEAAVKAFQNRRNLASDGIVGQKTWYELTK
ncbi:peptidoglycan-binding domain-containing protein [Fischerella sp. PCC 9605]|uniref:peptidoglycan-binding domain-containing protein n=1 Tax=Fischerella sp. PCC 9605 TaxID=1173024 RepID=UPI0004790A37|nr:peptidoglycan-binding domain-containing protein [Fischerella sp. PCC 9605]